jgi:hypothetical protein
VIVTRLSGGLGNQLFQYAAGRSLAARLGVELRLDSSWIKGRGGAPPGAVRRYELERFDHPVPLVDAADVARLPPQTRLAFHARRLVRGRGKPDLTALVDSPGPEIDERIFEAPDNTYLLGHWESERYFAEHAELIRAELTFRPPPTHVAEIARQLAEQHTVSIHVRRGDKIADTDTSRKHVSLTGRWYVAALRELARHVDPLDAVYVFSDDPAWCRDNLELPFPTVMISGNTSSEDLQLMSLCRHHVIANSTFSWWGAWLNPRPDKVVVAPTTWRLDRPTIELVAPGWLQVPN